MIDRRKVKKYIRLLRKSNPQLTEFYKIQNIKIIFHNDRVIAINKKRNNIKVVNVEYCLINKHIEGLRDVYKHGQKKI